MRPLFIALAVAAVLAGAWQLRPQFMAQAAPGADADMVMEGRVTKVADGDTLEVRFASGSQRIRLYGIDAPEARAPAGREATQALKRLVATGAVEVQPVADDPYDKYDRLVAVLYARGVNVNEQLVRDGHAWAFRRYLGQLDGDQRYCELEAAARDRRRGLWSMPAERWVPPWIYRAREQALPGAVVPSADYRAETAAACIAASGQAQRVSDSQGATRAAPSSAAGARGGSSHPAGCDIKGNINVSGVKIYHLPGTESYADTHISTAQGERWFCSEAEAQAAGWRPAR